MTVVSVAPGIYRVSDGTESRIVAVAGPVANRWVWDNGVVHRLDPPDAGKGRGGRQPTHELAAPMPATVLRVATAVGARVMRGDTLITLEAMKMEMPIRAPHDGRVTAIHCQVGELVQPGVTLLDLQADASADKP